MSSVVTLSDKVIQSIGIDPTSFRPTSFTFFLKSVPSTWKAYTIDNTHFPIYRIVARGAKSLDMRNLITGIKKHYIILAELEDFDLLCISRHTKGEQPLLITLRQDKDYDRIINVFRRFKFTSDILSAHYAINKSIELLKSGSGEGPFVNRGLFSNHFLRERLEKGLSARKRDVWKEATSFFANFSENGISVEFEGVGKVLKALGFTIKNTDTYSNEYPLYAGSELIKTAIVIASNTDNLDVMKGDDRTVPSYIAVAALSRYPWVILTNGRIWRLYSSKVSSASTNYFEVDIDGIVDEKDPRLKYFVSLFSSSALIPKQTITDLDYVLEGGMQYARELEENLRKKVFDKQLFLDLVRGVRGHSNSRRFSEEELEKAKKKALKLLYRLLFILYAESRFLLPIRHIKYSQISLSNIRERLTAMEKEPDSSSAWKALQVLFRAISEGDPAVNLPQYNGGLFEPDETIDNNEIINKHLVPALHALMEIDGKGIDYQNLGVRQLGSLYEALLEYSVSQAQKDQIILNGEILDMSFVSDLKGKPDRTVEKGDLYLIGGGLARKETGSYFTSDKIVKFLVRKGLELIFQDREQKFKAELEKWRKNGDPNVHDVLRNISSMFKY